MDRRSDYLYHLPEELIAQQAIEPRDASRLLVLDRSAVKLQHSHFSQLPRYLNPGDTLVFNNTRVIPARLHGHRESGGQVELLLLEETADLTWDCLARPAKKIKSDTRIHFNGDMDAVVLEEGEAGRRTVRFEAANQAETTVEMFWDWLAKFGSVPLPPYIHREPITADEERYQTIYAKHDGSVAAPTAGLHFTPQLLQTLQDKGIQAAYVTLHVGIGTFRPVEVDNLADHKMDEERYFLNEETATILNRTRNNGGRIIAVGTTSVRTLESTIDQDGRFSAKSGRTDLFIRPPYKYKGVDALVTNFHLPGSTLMMLVSALADRESILSAYQQAVAEKYRFFSYGDAMLIL
ncbi:MAG TPA: tRNA preQ1(34) S-adenosylmethionine ribosyltransferase-isomerase QueA [Bacteroidetes bacterium]|nr:S-adenosylmethionine:tRNA ribosyltransferase-isomerase [bacterium BMS3Bbin04]HDO65449.1 tRNA preQ1(34) S-adenosylmethionine ribosyltransferase-isomerase QueA [Bacteroidota bacterium]HEX04574.1 tRNA preQ1(34) S-adenosylmethionine ribosyltransferase-isomerase QueA [Bacteroidota bacterium]